MAKTLRVRNAVGWTTKPAPDLPENRLTAGEVDDNFLAQEADLAAHAAASDPHPVYAFDTHNHDTAYSKLETAFNKGDITGATTFNVSQGALQYATVTGAVSWSFSGWPAVGTVGGVTVELTNGGSQTQTWNGVKWDGGAAPTLTAAGVDVLEFYTRDGGTTVRGFLAAKDSK